MSNVILHFVFKFVNNFFKIFRFGWRQYLKWIKHLSYEICVRELVCILKCRFFVLLLFESFLLDRLFILSLFAVNNLNVLHLSPFSLFENLFNFNLIFNFTFILACIVRVQIFTILNQKGTVVNLLLIFVSLCPFISRFVLINSLTLL